MRDTLIISIDSVLRSANQDAALINGKYVPARPAGFWSWSYRLKATWLVFTGKADALIWPESVEHEGMTIAGGDETLAELGALIKDDHKNRGGPQGHG